MNIIDYIQTIINSTGKDWHNISCWGHGSGPSYKDHFKFYNGYKGQENIILLESHYNHATYKPDIKISIAWGLRTEFGDEEQKKIKENWSINYPDKSGAIISYVDFFYNNSLVFRKNYGTVDGGRCSLPIPYIDNNGEFVASREFSDIMRVLNDIEGGVNYDNYMEQSGIKLIEESILGV